MAQDKPVSDPVPVDLDADRHKNQQRLLWGVVCIVGPGLLFVAVIFIYSLLNLATVSNTPVSPTETDLFTQASPGRTAANLILYLVGTLTAIAFIPGAIIGVILLSKRRKPRQ